MSLIIFEGVVPGVVFEGGSSNFDLSQSTPLIIMTFVRYDYLAWFRRYSMGKTI